MKISGKLSSNSWVHFTIILLEIICYKAVSTNTILYTVSETVFILFVFVTSAQEVMLLPGFVCGFVSLFVNKRTQIIMGGF